MSGYSGQDPQADAMRLGAQDIIGKPFSNEQLLAKVKALLQRARGESGGGVSPDTRADVLEALRRSAGLTRDSGTMTSEELFGDLIGDEGEPGPADTQRISVTPTVQPAPASPAPAAVVKSAVPLVAPVARGVRPVEPDTAVERVLETTMADIRSNASRGRVREDTNGASVDALLSQTLSGLDVRSPRPAPKPEPVPPAVSLPFPSRSQRPSRLHLQPSPPPRYRSRCRSRYPLCRSARRLASTI